MAIFPRNASASGEPAPRASDPPQYPRGLQKTKLVRRRDGDWRWHRSVTAPVKEGDRTVQWIDVALDIDDGKQMDLERQKFMSLVETSTDFIGMAGIDFRTFYVNEAGLQLVGLARDEASTDILDNMCRPSRGSCCAMWDCRPSSTTVRGVAKCSSGTSRPATSSMSSNSSLRCPTVRRARCALRRSRVTCGHASR